MFNRNKLMNRIFALAFLLLGSVGIVRAQEERKLWLDYLDKTARPVLSALAADRL
jgi:hypothetical protein